MIKHGFIITILLMGGFLILRAYLDPPKTEIKKDYYYEHKNMEKTWSNPDNLKQIKKKYGIK